MRDMKEDRSRTLDQIKKDAFETGFKASQVYYDHHKMTAMLKKTGLTDSWNYLTTVLHTEGFSDDEIYEFACGI